MAILKGQLIDHGSDDLVLLSRLDAQYPDDIVLMRRVLTKPEPELLIRAPRLIGD